MPSVRSDAPFVTPTGWALAGELTEGSQVFAATGKPTTVTSISYEHPDAAMEVKMVMEPFVVSDDHDAVLGLPFYGPWIGPADHTKERAQRLIEPLAPSRRVILDLPDLDLPLDPWAYGYWRVLSLPDGVLAVLGTLAEKAKTHLESVGLPVARVFEDRHLTYLTCPDIPVALEKLGDQSGYHPDYLRAGEQQRRGLLAGIFDARGRYMGGITVDAGRAVVEAAAELAMSLGLRASTPARGIPRVRISPHDAEMLLRREELDEFLRGPARPGYRQEVPYMIRKARYVPSGDFVSVKTQASTYLLGKAMIPVRDH